MIHDSEKEQNLELCKKCNYCVQICKFYASFIFAEENSNDFIQAVCKSLVKLFGD